MESINNNSMCRCCATETTCKEVNIAYVWMGQEEVYADMLRDCFDISLCEDVTGKVPGGICEPCIMHLRNASNFKKQVLYTEQHFKQMLDEKMSKGQIIKIEFEDEDTASVVMSETSVAKFENSVEKIEVTIKMETEEVPIQKKPLNAPRPSTKASTSKHNKAKKVTKVALKKVRRASMLKVKRHKNNLLKILMHSNANPIKCVDMLEGIQCHYCDTIMKESEHLKEHFASEHRNEKFISSKMKDFVKTVWKLDVTDLQCEICNSQLNNIKDLLQHFKFSHNLDVELDIEDIYLPFKFDTEELRCAICNIHFPLYKLLREHMNTHFRNFVCDICDTGYVNHELLYRHKRRHLVSMTSCQFCDKTYSSKQRAHRHMQMVHLGLLRYKCNYCDERFQEFNMRLSHMQKAHDKSLGLSCQICDKMYVTPKALQAHVRGYHMLEKRYLCAECGKTFTSPSLLRDHASVHIKNFTCDLCSAKFQDRQKFEVHLLATHQVQCLFCTKKFLDNDLLKVHLEESHANIFECKTEMK